MACAWHRQVRLAALAAAKHTPRKRQQEQHEKPNRKRGGAEPSPLNRLGSAAAFSAAHGFLSLVFIVLHLLNFASFGSLRLA